MVNIQGGETMLLTFKGVQCPENDIVQFIERNEISVWWRSLESHTYWVSDKTSQIFGYAQEFLNNNLNIWNEIIFPDDKMIIEAALKKCKAGHSTNIEYRAFHSDGRMIWIHDHATPIMDENEKVIAISSVIFDISEYKRISLQLDESEERFYNLVEMAPISILVYQEGKIVYANPLSQKTLGSTLEGKSIVDFIHQESLELFYSQLNRVLNGHEMEFLEYRLVKPDGSEILAEGASQLVTYKSKPAVLILGIDITEKKKLKSELFENQNRYKSLFEHNANGVFSINIDKKFTSCNIICEQLTGYSESELLNLYFPNIFVCEEISKVTNYFKMAQKGLPQNFRTAIIQKTGTILYLNMTIVPIKENEKVTGVFGILRDITEQVESEKAIHHLAYHDYLTGLPNRYMLDQQLCGELLTAAKNSTPLALLFLDLDRFKVINDTLSHSSGDQLLNEVAKRLISAVGNKNIVFRQGGDEFVIILSNANACEAAEIAKKIDHSFSEPFCIKNEKIYTSSSIGISLYPGDGDTIDSLLKNAEIAMYQAKRAGNKNYRFFSALEAEGQFSPLKIEMDLHTALENNEFTLYYQPKVHLKTGKIVGFEALIRWNHPEMGLVSPDKFIPIAEESGLIIPIGKWVLFEACKQNKQWHNRGFETIISVNLSPRQFKQTNMVQIITETLHSTGLKPQYLEFEITESMTADIKQTLSTLKELKSLGIQISIDDFGTGFSSLNYLKEFPIDTLKIDQSFVMELYKNPNDETIVKTIISMAHNLNLNVVAEGIETQEQLIFLQEHVCNVGQGYFFSKPLSASDLEEKFQEIEQLVETHGFSQDISQNRWKEELNRVAIKELTDTVRMQQGLTSKIKKINGNFIFTFADGELLYRLGVTPDLMLGRGVHELKPEHLAKKSVEYMRKAWEEAEIVNVKGEWNGVHFLGTFRPITQNGKVTEIIGSFIDITDIEDIPKNVINEIF
jgi:diguanylate cyclase (GGDEF)-like protein/PAS domain S-box-containing protein